MEDEEIIALYHCRSEEAIVQTDKKHGSFCRRLAFHILSDREDAEECVNDTYLAAWKAMPPERPASLRAFLGRITRNLSISRFRKNRAAKRYAGMELMLSELEECIPGNCMDVQMEQRALSDLMIHWLDGLSKEERILFVQRYWYGDMVKDLAARSGITANQMARRMQRLRQSLKEALEKEGIGL